MKGIKKLTRDEMLKKVRKSKYKLKNSKTLTYNMRKL